VKIMIVWRTVPGKYKAAVEQFLSTGGPVPAGCKALGRWHVPGSVLGWHLIEADDLTAAAHHVAEWGDVLECEKPEPPQKRCLPSSRQPRPISLARVTRKAIARSMRLRLSSAKSAGFPTCKTLPCRAQ
jgi:hypothetical protein